jgi:hypothetical protein
MEILPFYFIELAKRGVHSPKREKPITVFMQHGFKVERISINL